MPRITKKGQITIPQDIREKFTLLPGTEVNIIVRDNQVLITKNRRENKFLKWLGQGKGLNKQNIDHMINQVRGRKDE